jgi:hypothetical protein
VAVEPQPLARAAGSSPPPPCMLQQGFSIDIKQGGWVIVWECGSKKPRTARLVGEGLEVRRRAGWVVERGVCNQTNPSASADPPGAWYAMVTDAPGRQPPFWAVNRPYKRAVPSRFTAENAEGA